MCPLSLGFCVRLCEFWLEREGKKKGCEEMNESLHHYNYCDMQHRLNNKKKKTVAIMW